MDWKDFFVGLCEFVASCFLLVVIGFWIFSDKRIEFYYTNIDSGHTNTTCLYGYRPWWTDERMYCSDDINKVIDVMNKLKGSNTK